MFSRLSVPEADSRESEFTAYLSSSNIIDWHHPRVLTKAQQLAHGLESPLAIAKACFEWVRDEIRHSVDYQLNPVTCRASAVLEHKTGYCFAKSHLLAALLRANQIPAGFCYQRLSLNDQGAPYSLHGLNAIHLPEFGWYRIDARGNKPGVEAKFTPPHEQLAYEVRLPEEVDCLTIFPEPLHVVVEVLQTQNTWQGVFRNLPDLDLHSVAFT
ncbi:MAG: transglutaminase family protein [Cyanobacteria bacterium P01_H01_bin.121]